VAGHRIALVRVEDDFYAIGDRCSHANYSLSEGEVYAEDREIECWKHGSTFSLVTGEPITLPATSPVPTYEVELVGDDVMVVLP
jgi:3-phenylpropionate/trans-cinnamate dioxygenase ferredoxin subunit